MKRTLSTLIVALFASLSIAQTTRPATVEKFVKLDGALTVPTYVQRAIIGNTPQFAPALKHSNGGVTLLHYIASAEGYCDYGSVLAEAGQAVGPYYWWESRRAEPLRAHVVATGRLTQRDPSYRQCRAIIDATAAGDVLRAQGAYVAMLRCDGVFFDNCRRKIDTQYDVAGGYAAPQQRASNLIAAVGAFRAGWKVVRADEPLIVLNVSDIWNFATVDSGWLGGDAAMMGAARWYRDLGVEVYLELYDLRPRGDEGLRLATVFCRETAARGGRVWLQLASETSDNAKMLLAAAGTAAIRN